MSSVPYSRNLRRPTLHFASVAHATKKRYNLFQRCAPRRVHSATGVAYIVYIYLPISPVSVEAYKEGMA